MILWSTDPSLNLNGKTIEETGVFLEATGEGFRLRFWDRCESGTVPLSETDVFSLRAVLNEVFPK